MTDQRVVERHASPNERRTIVREDLGFYHSLTISAVYEFEHGLDVTSPASFYAPLTRCVEEHPFLTVVVSDGHTEKPFYQRVPSIDLRLHISVLDSAQGLDQWRDIEDVLRSQIDSPLPPDIPPWRIVVLPLARQPSSCLVAFVYSHTILDGVSGLTFHRAFLAAARSDGGRPIISPVIATPPNPLPPAFDTPEKLPISWAYLLRPLIAVLIPRFLANWLGLKAQSSDLANAGTWTGAPCAFSPGMTQMKLTLGVIPPPQVEKALGVAREKGARLTGIMHVLLVRALSKALADKPGVTNFVSQTAINMRGAAGAPRDEMGEFASAVDLAHPRVDNSVCEGLLTDDEWAFAREAGERFADAVSRLSDQPVGLLRYVPSIRRWMLAKIGQKREASYELSNVGVFEDEDGQKGQARIKDMVFAQPGMVVGPAICVNVVGVKGGSLVYSITWVTGALGLEGDEESFIEGLRKSIREDFEVSLKGKRA